MQDVILLCLRVIHDCKSIPFCRSIRDKICVYVSNITGNLIDLLAKCPTINGEVVERWVEEVVDMAIYGFEIEFGWNVVSI